MKALLLYLSLVGLPVVGLLGILHAGSRLQAPPDVAGEWPVEGMAYATPGEQRPLHALRISQSGRYLTVTVGNEELRGRLHGDSLRVVRPPSGGAGRDCASSGYQLLGTFDFSELPHALYAHVIPPDGSHCAVISLVSYRGGGSREGEIR